MESVTVMVFEVNMALTSVSDPGGLTDAQFDACMRDTAAEKALEARVDRHEHVDKIESTPTFIINGKRIEGEMTLPELDAAIAQAAG